MQSQTSEEIKKVIKAELPRLMEEDADIRRFILNVTRERYPDRRETESRFDRVLDQLVRDREAQEKKWEENQKVIREMLTSIKTVDRRIDSTIDALGARWGLRAEGAFRHGLRGILEESFGVKVERYEDFDHEGSVFGRPDQVELDLIVHDGTLILCEIKSSVCKSDVYAFRRKKDFYEKKHDRKADRAMVISPMIDERAGRVAKELNIETYGYAEDVRDIQVFR